MKATNSLPDSPRQRSRWWRRLLDITLILALILGVRTWQQWGMTSGIAPDFEHKTLNGSTLYLDDYRGKPVLLYFWASWCPMCELEQDTITALNKDWKVITVAFQSGGEEEVKRYVERKGLQDWPVIVDEEGKLAAQYGVKGVPASYIVDEEGTIRFREVGLTSSWGLRLRLWLAQWLVSWR